MEKSEFKKLLKEVKYTLKMNNRLVERALFEESSKGNSTNLKKIMDIIDEYEKIEEYNEENKKLAVYYAGNPEITVTYMLDSIIYNNNITLCTQENKTINTLLSDFVKDALVNCKIKNTWIDYNPKYNEVYLKDNCSKFDKMIYIGDYFEYERFKSFMNTDVEYNNFGTMKLFIDQSKYRDEYQKIMNYSAKENIFLEVYNDEQEFITESKPENFSVVFGDIQTLNNVKRELKGEMLFNAFPFDNYKFKINR